MIFVHLYVVSHCLPYVLLICILQKFLLYVLIISSGVHLPRLVHMILSTFVLCFPQEIRDLVETELESSIEFSSLHTGRAEDWFIHPMIIPYDLVLILSAHQLL
jgi:hypothetical protein